MIRWLMTNQNELESAAELIQAFVRTPQLIALLEAARRDIAALRQELTQRRALTIEPDGWIDAKAAAKYMGISASSFDKYRYETTPRITGCKLDGKTLYKRSDLDNFIRLYELKSNGFA